MRSLLALVALLAPLPALAQPARPVRVTNFPEVQEVTGSVEVTNLPGPGGACAPFQLVGFTAATFTGGQGVLGFTRACQAEFPGSRMCESQEILATTQLPSTLSGNAWVQPSIVSEAAGAVVDASGAQQSAMEMTCFGWSHNLAGAGGLLVDAAGRFTPSRHLPPAGALCDTAHAVSCCAAVP